MHGTYEENIVELSDVTNRTGIGRQEKEDIPADESISFSWVLSPPLYLSRSLYLSTNLFFGRRFWQEALPELRDLDASLESGPSRGPLAMPTCNTGVVDVEGVPAKLVGSIFVVELHENVPHGRADAPKVLLWLEIAL